MKPLFPKIREFLSDLYHTLDDSMNEIVPMILAIFIVGIAVMVYIMKFSGE